MTVKGTIRRFSNNRRRVSRAQIGANSGQVRVEQRRTPSGIGRAHLQRCQRASRSTRAAAWPSRAMAPRPGLAREPLDDPLQLRRQLRCRGVGRFYALRLTSGLRRRHGFESRMRLRRPKSGRFAPMTTSVGSLRSSRSGLGRAGPGRARRRTVASSQHGSREERTDVGLRDAVRAGLASLPPDTGWVSESVKPR